MAHEAGKQPRDTVLGRQAAAGEGNGHLGALGGEAKVAGDGLDEPDAGGGTVDGCDNGLGDLADVDVRAGGSLAGDGAGSAAGRCLAERLHVETRAEGLADAAHDNDAYVGVHRRSAQGLEVGVLEVEAPAVVALGTVPLEEQDTLLETAKDKVSAAAHAPIFPRRPLPPPNSRSDGTFPTHTWEIVVENAPGGYSEVGPEKWGARFSWCDIRPSRASGPPKPSIS